jgi:hypothetical protein
MRQRFAEERLVVGRSKRSADDGVAHRTLMLAQHVIEDAPAPQAPRGLHGIRRDGRRQSRALSQDTDGAMQRRLKVACVLQAAQDATL